MSATKTILIIGGRQDRKVLAIPADQTVLRVPIQLKPINAFFESFDTPPDQPENKIETYYSETIRTPDFDFEIFRNENYSVADCVQMLLQKYADDVFPSYKRLNK